MSMVMIDSIASKDNERTGQFKKMALFFFLVARFFFFFLFFFFLRVLRFRAPYESKPKKIRGFFFRGA